MKDKVVIITGSSSGIGKAAAAEIASMGAHVVMVARNREKAEAVRAEISAKTGNSNIDLFIADLSLVKESASISKEIAAKYPVIDVLINNAGMIFPEKMVTKEGFEQTFALNHLGYFVVTNHLLPNLKKSKSGRIVNLASTAQKMGTIRFDDPNFEKSSYSAIKAYAQSKLANIMFTYELANRLDGSTVCVNAIHPGVVGTGFARDYKGFAGWLVKISKPLLRNSDKGAETAVWLAASSEVEGITGKYFSDKKAIKSIPLSYDRDACRRLWELSEMMVLSVS